MIDAEDNGKVSSLIVGFMDSNRVDIKLKIAYLLTFQLNDSQQKKIDDFMKIRKYCSSLLNDEAFIRALRKRLSVTEEADSVKYWDSIIDKFDDTYNYNRKLEARLIKIEMHLLEFIARLLREIEVQNLEFSIG